MKESFLMSDLKRILANLEYVECKKRKQLQKAIAALRSARNRARTMREVIRELKTTKSNQ